MILFLALYPQLALHRSEGSVKARRGRGAALTSRPGAATRRLVRECAAARARPARRSRRSSLGWRGDQAVSAAVLATAHLKGPHVDFAGLSPLIALLGGAVRRADVRPARLALGARARSCPRSAWSCSARRSGLTIWQWDAQKSIVVGRAADRRPGARAEPDPDRRRRLHGAAGVALAAPRAKPPTASSTRCC